MGRLGNHLHGPATAILPRLHRGLALHAMDTTVRGDTDHESSSRCYVCVMCMCVYVYVCMCVSRVCVYVCVCRVLCCVCVMCVACVCCVCVMCARQRVDFDAQEFSPQHFVPLVSSGCGTKTDPGMTLT